MNEVAGAVENLLNVVFGEKTALNYSADCFEAVGVVELDGISDNKNLLFVTPRLREIDNIIALHHQSIGIGVDATFHVVCEEHSPEL